MRAACGYHTALSSALGEKSPLLRRRIKSLSEVVCGVHATLLLTGCWSPSNKRQVVKKIWLTMVLVMWHV